MKNIIDIGNEFYHRLANRDEKQGDGKHTAVEFRRKYLMEYDNDEVWNKANEPIVFDFKNVVKIGPSFANEAFAYFTKYTTPNKIFNTVKFINITKVMLIIIEDEVNSGYKGK